MPQLEGSAKKKKDIVWKLYICIYIHIHIQNTSVLLRHSHFLALNPKPKTLNPKP